ncbi:DUF349 domain-containing protein [Rheinheimera marina]|uniref:DUF349 domain-containing protein n=1 Tax=Rheinheimera marina TaxID=1774958 RepID=A0ABV9JIB4_9GAMM
MMIFKRWFAPKWQHKDAAVRQQAIAELSVTNEHKQILHELAFNDGHEAVRRAALDKLNEFSLWWQASKQDNAERLKQYAEQQLIQMVLDNRISGHLKHQFVEQCHRSSVLEKLALSEPDADLRFFVLQRLNKSELIALNLQQNLLSLEQKRSLLQQVDEPKLLEKLSRQLTEPLASELKLQLQHEAQAREKPILLRKQVNLVLAKLNSVREKGSLEQMQQKWAQFEREWQECSSDLALLPDAVELTDKFQKIKHQTEQSWKPMLAQQAEQQAALAAHQAQQTLQAELSAELQQIRLQVQSLLQQGELTQAMELSPSLQAFSARLSSLGLSSAASAELNSQLQQLSKQLQQLPHQAEQLALLTRLIAEWSATAVPADVEQYLQHRASYQLWQKQWKQAAYSLGALLPDHLQRAQQQLLSQWQQPMQDFAANLEREQKQLKAKLAEFRRLHSAGRFNVLFGLLKGIEQSYQQWPTPMQALLEKDLQQARAVIAELTELQSYIATPRKQELVAQMQQLAAEPATDVTQRAALVKQSRANWLSLGKADAGLEEGLNQAFNLACEQAFAPCREYFAKLDEERTANAALKQQLLAQLKGLLELPAGKELDTQLAKLQQQWRSVGPVDAAVHKTLSADYKEISAELKQRLSHWQQANADAKKALILQAKAALELGSGQAVSLVKALQQQWKTQGFAGKADQSLWQEFRAECDKIFAALTAEREVRAQQALQELELADQQIAELEALWQTEQTTAQLQQLLTQLSAVNAPAKSETASKKHQLRQAIVLRLEQLQNQQANAGLEQLLSALEQQQAELLPALYREQLTKTRESVFSRAQLTWAIAVVQGKTPACSESERAQVQLMLLSEKHNQAQELSAQALLLRWLSLGMPTAEELGLVQQLRLALV